MKALIWIVAFALALLAQGQEFTSQITGNVNLSFSHLGSSTPTLLDYDSGGGDTVSLLHGGNEFFFGITNSSGSKGYVDFNIEGEAEYVMVGESNASLTALAHRFYIGTKTNGLIKYLDVTTNGIGSTRVTASLGFASLTNAEISPEPITLPASGIPWTNKLPFNIVVYVDNTGAIYASVSKNGRAVFSGIATAATLMLKPGDSFTETYASGSPTACWEPQ